MDYLNDNLEKILLLPGFIIVMLVAFVPVVYLFYTSAFDYSPLMRTFEFIGFRNYIEILSSQDFWRYLSHTLIYAGGTTTVVFTLGLGGAWSLNQIKRGRLLFLMITLLPFMLPMAAGAVMAQWMFNDLYGVVNHLLQVVGLINQPVAWLTQTVPAFVIVVLTDAWCNMPLAFIILFAGFQRVPAHLEDAARVDGANKLQTLTNLYLPFIRPEIFMVLFMITMFSFRHFAIVYLVTGEGPGDSTAVLATYIQKTAMANLEYGKASAIAVIMVIITIIYAGWYFLWAQKRGSDVGE